MATGTIQKVTNDSGSNANDAYIKFPDGVMICWGKKDNIANGYTPITFASEFYATPTITISTGAGGGRFPLYVEDATKSGFRYYRPDTSGSTCWGRYIAIGFWK